MFVTSFGIVSYSIRCFFRGPVRHYYYLNG